MTNKEISLIFHEIGTLLEIKGENSFKCRAYLNAARTLENFTGDLSELVTENRLQELPGIGDALQEKSSLWPEPDHCPTMRN